jgi:hypothetical protein
MRYLILVLLIFGTTIYALVDCARRDDSQIKTLPKWGWILIIILLSLETFAIGPIAYLIAGRVRINRGPKPTRRILPPDDDPDFLGKL